MNKQNTRLLTLRVLVKLMSLLALGAVFWVLFASVPEPDSREAQITSFNISDMQPGDARQVVWESKPLWIVYRKPSWESALASFSPSWFEDPSSRHSVQPAGAANSVRSSVPEWFVTLGLGTGSGCALEFVPPSDDGDLSDQLNVGGFTDGCDQSRYDLAGRVFIDQQARRNTVIPAWELSAGMILVFDK